MDELSPAVPGTLGAVGHGTLRKSIADSRVAPAAEGLHPERPPEEDPSPLPCTLSESASQQPHLGRAASMSNLDTAPALSLSSSPHLSRREPSGNEAGASTSPSLPASAAAGDVDDWGNSPLPRLSRSLSLSQSSGWSGSGGSGSGSGCAKMTRTCSRRRSRASSSCSPLPLLETPACVASAGQAERGGAVGAGGMGGMAGPGSLGSSSVGSALGAVGHQRRRRRSSMVASVEGLRARMPGDVGMSTGLPIAPNTAPLSRSHDMQSSGWARPLRRNRPTSLPNGLDLAGLAGMGRGAARGEAQEEYAGGDPGLGWVLRAPAGPLLRHRSQSCAGSPQVLMGGFHARSCSVSRLQHPVPAQGPAPDRRVSRLPADTGEDGEDGDGEDLSPQGMMQVALTRTPQASWCGSTSAVGRRSNNLSSVARRMDRLEIRSGEVDTQAAQVKESLVVG